VYHWHLDSFKASWRQYFFARPTRHDSARSWLLRLLELRHTNFPTYLLTYLLTCVICQWQLEADCDRSHAAISSSSQLRQILDDVVLPCLHHWHGTGCHQRSGTISRWNLSSLNSKLIYLTALTSIILSWHWYACSQKSRPCNGWRKHVTAR